MQSYAHAILKKIEIMPVKVMSDHSVRWQQTPALRVLTLIKLSRDQTSEYKNNSAITDRSTYCEIQQTTTAS